MEQLVEGKGGCRRKGKRKMRDEAVEEGYITRAQRETTGPERKRKQRWNRRAWRKSLALILYGRCVSSLSLAPVLANLSVVFFFTNIPSFSFSLPFTNFRQEILNVDLITVKPTSYFLIQFPLSSVKNLSFRVAPRISPAVVSHSLHLRYTQRPTEMPCQMTILIPSWDWDPSHRLTVSH